MLTLQQLRDIDDIAAMNNHKTTLATLSKAFFDGDYQAMHAKENEMKYAKDACFLALDLAFTTQFHNNATLEQKKFRAEVNRIKDISLRQVGGRTGGSSRTSSTRLDGVGLGM